MVYRYFIPDLLLRTLRFTEIKTCETVDELSWVIVSTVAIIVSTIVIFVPT